MRRCFDLVMRLLGTLLVAEPLILSAEQSKALVARDVERWVGLVRSIGITPE